MIKNRLRFYLNVLIIMLLIILIGLILYIIIYQKSIINKLIANTIQSLQNNKANIQPVIDSYTTTSAQNLVNRLNNTPLNTPFEQAVSGEETNDFKGGLLQSVLNNILDDEKLKTDFEDYISIILSSPSAIGTTT